MHSSATPEPTDPRRSLPQDPDQRKSEVQARERRALLRSFLIQAVVYAVLVTLYFLVVLRLLTGPLDRLFHDRPVTYAVLGLVLILAQGAALEYITAFLLEQLRLEERE